MLEVDIWNEVEYVKFACYCSKHLNYTIIMQYTQCVIHKIIFQNRNKKYIYLLNQKYFALLYIIIT